MDKNNKSIFIIIISIALVIISGTFAWLSWRSQNTAMVLTIGDIRGLSVSLKPYQINATLSPVASYTSSTNVITVDVTADNKKTEEDDFKLFYKIDTIDDALKSEGFKYTITKCTSNCTNANNYTVINNAGGDFSTASSNSNMEIYNESIPANTTYNYKVYLWIDSNAGNQSNMQNKTFTGELRATISETLYTMMRDNAVMDNTKSKFVTATTGIKFSNTPSDTNGKGIYIRSGTENDSYPIYYYRGAVTGNNVLFAGFCWKIVRTTSTGGTKLIYNGVPSGENNNDCSSTSPSIGKNSFSSFASTNISLADVGYMYGARYVYKNKTMTSNSSTYMYGTGYDETNHKLVSTDAMNFAGTDWGTYYNQLNNNHYTCFNTSGECDQVNFIFYTNSSKAFYVTIPSGKTIGGILDEMLSNSTNTKNSNAKTIIDTWYAGHLVNSTSKLEDTPWCNDRAISSYGGWNPNGRGNVTTILYFIPHAKRTNSATPSLICNTNDAFTVNTKGGNGRLTYPIGLLTVDEMILAGYSNTSYLYYSSAWKTMSPDNSRYNTDLIAPTTIGTYGANFNAGSVNVESAFRPLVSLKSGTKFSGGTGIATDPYVIE